MSLTPARSEAFGANRAKRPFMDGRYLIRLGRYVTNMGNAISKSTQMM